MRIRDGSIYRLPADISQLKRMLEGYPAGLDDLDELAWFPSTARTKARAVWKRPLPLRAWLYARQWSDVGLAAQPDPKARLPESGSKLR
jgi:hypothetical protein